MEYYVYVLKDKEKTFYVGKGTKDRMYIHYKRAKNTKIKSPVLDKIRKMVKNNSQIIYEKVFITDNEQKAFEYEIYLINKIGRKDLKKGTLLNLTNGGDGVCGYKYTEEHRKNLSCSIKKAIIDGKFTPPKYINHTPVKDDCKNKISITLKEYWKDDKKRKELSQKMKSKLDNGKRIISNESREKMNTASKRIWTDEDREKCSDRLKKLWENKKKKNVENSRDSVVGY